MIPSISADICFLLLMPWSGPRPSGATPLMASVAKNCPYFFDLDLEILPLNDEYLELEATTIRVRTQLLDGQIWVAECYYTIPDVLTETAVWRKRAIQSSLQQALRRQLNYNGAFAEEYSVVLLNHVGPAPDEFVDTHAHALARLLRSLEKPLTNADTQEILEAKTRYAQDDLTIVDWEGAMVITADGDYQSDIELLKIGNYQLLRYRLLDYALEKSLADLRQRLTQSRGLGRSNRLTQQGIVEQRLSILLDFEKTDQSLLLIGDWYPSQVYRLIVDQFYLDDWKTAVQTKLDNLAAIDEIVRQHLTFSWQRFLDIVQIVGWLILLIGYFILFFADLGWFSK